MVKADIDAVKQTLVSLGKMPLCQACALVAQQLGYAIPEFPRQVRDLLASDHQWIDLAQTLTLAQVQSALTVAQNQLAV